MYMYVYYLFLICLSLVNDSPSHVGPILLPPNVGYRGMVPPPCLLGSPLDHVLLLVTNDVVFSIQDVPC